jgi:hypothetical protein
MSKHPRYIHFPWQSDYSSQPNFYSPYAVSVAQPGYRSSSLNIDSLGFRYQYDLACRLIDLKIARAAYKECTLLLGNSTAFGVSLSGDCKTLGHFLGTTDSPCINLGVRGATMQQELAVYLTHKHLLPPHRRIILLTGVCDISLATQPEDLWSAETGGMHSIETFYKQHCYRAEVIGGVPEKAKRAFLDWAEDRYHRTKCLQRVFERRVQKGEAVSLISPIEFNNNLDRIFPLMRNVLQTWGWIRKSTDIDVQVVLQPVLGWTVKPLSPVEHQCVQTDIERIPAIPLYANQAVHKRVRAVLQESCLRNQLTFADANSRFDSFNKAETLFSDICHLTDHGTKRLAACLSQGIDDASLVSS